MKRSLSKYCYVANVTDDDGNGGQFQVGKAESFNILLAEVGTSDTITVHTRDLSLVESLELGDRFEVQLKFKPRKSGVTHADEVL